MKQSIWKYADVKTLRSEAGDRRVVLVGGCFDLLHFGHYSFLKAARAEGDILVVALESDEFIQKQKKRTPIHTQEQRAELLRSLDIVDTVILLPYLDTDHAYQTMVERISPAVVAITAGDPYEDTKRTQIEALGGRLAVVSTLLPGFSTSKILETLEQT